MGFIHFFDYSVDVRNKLLLQVSRKVAALYHKLCSLLSQQIILHLQKHRSLYASLLCLGGRGEAPSGALKVRSQ